MTDARGADAPSRLPLALACGGSFLAFLDATIINLAVPDLQKHFGGTSLRTLSWVITLYAVSFAAVLAPAGRLADAFGRRPVFALGVAVFGAGSLGAALAPALPILLVARTIQGLGAALLIPASLAILLVDLPPGRRTAAIGLWSAAASVAAAIGPSLGGLLVATFDWRALFVINLPPVIVLLRTARMLPAPHQRQGPAPDLPGVGLLVLGVAGLVLTLTEGSSWQWTSGATVGCLAVAGAALAAVVMRSRHRLAPALDVQLWRNRGYAVANVISVLFGMALYAALLLGVLFLTSEWHYSVLRAGLATTPGAFAAALVGICIARLSRRPGNRQLAGTGAAIMTAAAGALWLWLPADPHFLTIWLPAGLSLGAGIAAVSIGVSSAATLAVPPTAFASATGLNLAARQLGGALGVAVLTILLANASFDGFRHAYLFAATPMAVAGLLSLFLRPPPATAPAGPVVAQSELAAS